MRICWGKVNWLLGYRTIPRCLATWGGESKSFCMVNIQLWSLCSSKRSLVKCSFLKDIWRQWHSVGCLHQGHVERTGRETDRLHMHIKRVNKKKASRENIGGERTVTIYPPKAFIQQQFHNQGVTDWSLGLHSSPGLCEQKQIWETNLSPKEK